MAERPRRPGWLLAWADLSSLGRAGMEALWSGLWYTTLFSNELPLSPVWVCLLFWGLIAVPFGLARLVQRFAFSAGWRRAAFLAWLAIAAPLSLEGMLAQGGAMRGPLELALLYGQSLAGLASPLPWMHLVALLLLTLRGLALAAGQPELRAAVFDFQVGLVFLLFHGILSLARRDQGPEGLSIYLLIGLMTLAATRISTAAFYHGGKIPRLGWGWAGGLLSGAALVVACGLGAGFLAAGQAGALLARLLLGLAALLALVLFVLLLPLFELLMLLALRLAEGLAAFLNSPVLQDLRNLIEQLSRLAEQASARSEPVLRLIQVATPTLIVLGLLAAVWLGLRLRERLIELRAEEGSEALASPAGLEGLWPGRLRPGGRRRGSLLAAARVRRIYAALLDLSAKRGQARPAQATPLEFLPALGVAFPRREAELARITGAYLRVRYGEYPETLGEVEEVETAWRRVRRGGGGTMQSADR